MANRMKAARPLPAPPPDPGPIRTASVVALDDDPAQVHLDEPAPGRVSTPARLALATSYRPALGDRVLVAASGDDLYVIGVLHAARPPALTLPGGGSASLEGEALAIRDAAGRLLVRFAEGAAEIAAPDGDLTLAAPLGRVVVRAGLDLELTTEGTLVQRAGHRVEVRAGDDATTPQLRIDAATTAIEATRVEVRADAAQLTTGQATVVARRVATTAAEIVETVERLEVNATRLVERTRDTFREASGLLQTRAGRARTLIEDAYALWSRRTTLASREETSIDGSKVLLG
ncbi:DUF3540 domain-containing protein [Chondromyces apiculatus]|uniref:DUF3540 domain-containing protein n=1 Tax=Chondromyces apiculatus DSM 436 TaxID=1192034 RepID=A0A017TFB7_9BACT|nr:DUF3540 domain-containing protein [Chondromyces apiculatus]EYF07311.1 Hypothetical protein CAP_0790 [Chondromyces apiculatus DSM 436]